MLVFQLDGFINVLRPVNTSEVQPLVHDLVSVTEDRMSPADLSASVEIWLQLTLLYRSRRRSLILQPYVMDVSYHHSPLWLIPHIFKC